MVREDTCWTLIHDAAAGGVAARASFSLIYLDVVRAFLGARWRGGRFLDRLEDAVQDVFVELFRPAGALDRVDRDGRGSFKSYLFGVVRNVALRHEERVRAVRDTAADLDALAVTDATVSAVFDREWARTILRRAAERQRQWAAADGEPGRRRLEVLALRLEDGLPIREIAARWQQPADEMHTLYRRAREEFKRALRDELRFHHPEVGVDLDAECLRLLSLLAGGRDG